MPTWKKVIVSGSSAHLTSVTASIFSASTTANTVGFVGTASWAQSASIATSASYVPGSIFTDANQVLSASFATTAALASAVVGFSRLVNKSTVDQTTTSTSLVDLTDISLSIAANQTVYFRAVLHVGTSASNGARYAVTIPTGATMKVMLTGQTTTAIAAGTSGNATQWITVSGTETGTINAITQANQNVTLEGWVTTSSTAGTIQVQGRTANAANTLTIYSGSFITGEGN